MSEELNAVNEEMNTEVPAEATETKATESYNLLDGTPCSKSAFIREQFTALDKSRKEISEEFGIPYRAVYGATVNMENAAEPGSRGVRGVPTRILVCANTKNYVVANEDGTFTVGTETFDVKPETIEVDRNTWIKEQVEAGANRGDLAKLLDVSYGVVYGATKDAESTRQKYEIELEDGTKIARSEYIRQLVAQGMPKGEIAKKLGVEYSVVWQATKKLKSVGEKFADDTKKLEKYLDHVENPEELKEIIAMLENVNIKVEADMVNEDEANADETGEA